ncbi:hypothetical protein KBTX_02245 [wastewater metagenome]|uniref:Sulfur carrier protein ThiS n=2 Tax=unclassified sequences TaxID=12908 RepID=A0A5B8RB53_9ZZZZ|nr:sulfur carrier protein ThiS [Arhodomonas aquaeolei]MCS4505230.1 sulfur carrier protein ThiS [Arhodomonas aquaeolei]QEA05916.1 hypothetical protein KBTEX_02245 [uncultured organism]
MQEQRAPIEIVVNGEPRQVSPGQSVGGLVADLGLTNRRIAVEVNEALVPRSDFQAHELAAGDRVEIVHAIGGG